MAAICSPKIIGQGTLKTPTDKDGWQAQLRLRFYRHGQHTRLKHHHRGPLRIQRPFYPENDGACHVYPLHPPGGVVGGDSLQLTAQLAHSSQALITTPAATKFYRSSGPVARQITCLQVAPGASLEWLPQETIIFQGGHVSNSIRVEVSGEGRFLGWEILCLGRPAADESFTTGFCHQKLEIWRDGVPLYLEQGRYQGGSILLQAPWGLQGFPVVASLVCLTDQRERLDDVRKTINGFHAESLIAASQRDGVLVCRYLGPSTEHARRVFEQVWTVLRPAVFGKAVVMPRIWQT